MTSRERPSSREDFTVALICAQPLEFDAICMVIDEFWDEQGDQYGKAHSDRNTYVTGRIGRHNVVITLLGKGKVNSSIAATDLRISYPNIHLSILIGVCGGIPEAGGKKICHGDVVISDTIVQYDCGRQMDDQFVRRKTSEKDPGNKTVRNLLETLNTFLGKRRLLKGCATFLEEIEVTAARSGQAERYKSPYAKMAQPLVLAGHEDTHMFELPTPTIHFGAMASGDTVMHSTEHRDRIAAAENVIAFEMEGAGVWQELPCIIVKGVSGFADGEKTEDWQEYAAAMAAATSKAILERYIHTDTRGTSAPVSSMIARQHGSTFNGTLITVEDVSQGNQMRVSSAQPPRTYEQGGSIFSTNIESSNSVRQGNVMEFF